MGNIVGTFDGSGSVVDHYTQGLGLTSQVSATGAAYYNFDLTGNTTELTGGGGAVQNTYSYLPFGEQLSATGSPANPFTYVGQFGVMDDGDGYYLMGVRQYDPKIGRFAEPDPVGLNGLDTNYYRYASNKPLAIVDPTGLLGIPVTILELYPEDVVQAAQRIANEASANVPSGTPELNAWANTEVFVTGRAQQLLQNTLGTIEKGLSWGTTAAETYEAWSDTQPVTPAHAGEILVLAGSGVSQDVVHGNLKKAAWDAGTALGHAARAIPGVDPAAQKLFRGWVDMPDESPFSPEALRLRRLRMPGKQVGAGQSQHLVNGDPNSLVGPAGFGTSGFIAPTQTLPYTINFANEPTADTPVQQVTVTEQLDPNLDWTTFQIGDFSIGGTVYRVPANNGFYSTRLDLTSTPGIYLDVTAGINLTTGLATWTFTSVDPTTGDLPTDIFTGFLPPDAQPPAGEAFVSYTVRPKTGIAIGTKVSAMANVVFFGNPGMNTNPVSNTIGGPNQDFVAQLYQDVLTPPNSPPRQVDPTGLAAWAGQLDQGNLTRGQVAGHIVTSPEYRTVVVQDAYNTYLHRPADPAGLAAWVAFLSHGGTDQAMYAQIIGSPEYFASRGSSTVDGFVTAVYSDVLGRAIHSNELPIWERILAGGVSRISVATDILASTEGLTRLVTGIYDQFLHRPPTTTELHGWIARLQAVATQEQLIVSLTGSAEYAQNAGGDANQIYVGRLYLDLLHRPADAGSLTAFTGFLDTGTETRQQVVQMFTSSSEYRLDLVTEDYLTYLHRFPGPGEVNPFVQLLANGDTDEQVAAIFLCSPEYFHKRGGGTNDGFLKALYPDVLDRPIDPAGEAAWLRYLAAGHTCQQVAEAIFASPEYLRDLVEGLYLRFLHRPADPTGLAAFVNALEHGARDEDVITGILASPEYFTKA
jgi:RHS repeat-associated protein